MKTQEFYRRHLPHLQVPDQTFFVTWLLVGAMPKQKIERFKEQSRTEENQTEFFFNRSSELNRLIHANNFDHFDIELDSENSGTHYLSKSKIAKIVADSLKYWDRKKIDLICYCIMSNHVHSVFSVPRIDSQGNEVYLVNIMESIKKFSARKCNYELGKSGQFWQHESYDRLIRDREELYRTICYVLDNPVRAGYCKSRSSYNWSYIKPEYEEFLFD